MSNINRVTQDFTGIDKDEQKENVENKGRGQGVANNITVPPTQISDDSRNMIAEQDHSGSDNKPNGGRV